MNTDDKEPRMNTDDKEPRMNTDFVMDILSTLKADFTKFWPLILAPCYYSEEAPKKSN